MDNDYELLYLAKDDDQVKDLIYQKYKNLKQYEDEITIDIDKKMQIKNIMKIVIPFKVRIFVKKILKRMNKNE